MKPFDILYKLSRENKIANHLFSLIYHCDIPMKLKVGNNIRFVHKALGVVISEGATIGNNVCIQHHVLIGEKNGTDFPVIEDDVVINPYSIIIGNVRIGKGSVIGAGSIVTKSTPPYCVIYNKSELICKKITECERERIIR